MRYFILKKQDAASTDFVDFWAKIYNYGNEATYNEFIGQLTTESIRNLFAWKATGMNRTSIMAGKNQFVETILEKLDHFQNIPLNTPEDANGFLTNELENRGMTWKIFTLHILHPDKFPIFDQHVYRAMIYLKTGEIKEIPRKNEEKQQSYINEYLHFYNEEHEYYEDRKLDKALFSFGRFLKRRLPGWNTTA